MVAGFVHIKVTRSVPLQLKGLPPAQHDLNATSPICSTGSLRCAAQCSKAQCSKDPKGWPGPCSKRAWTGMLPLNSKGVQGGHGTDFRGICGPRGGGQGPPGCGGGSSGYWRRRATRGLQRPHPMWIGSETEGSVCLSMFQSLQQLERLPKVQGHLAHKKTPTPLGPPLDPWHGPTVGS